MRIWFRMDTTLSSSIRIFRTTITNTKITLLLVLLCQCCQHVSSASDWGYDEQGTVYGPSKWHKVNKECAGERQSPIAFYRDDVIVNSTLAPLEFINYKKEIDGGTVYINNNGHTFEVDLEDVDRRLQGGGLPTWYQLKQFHFHWGKEDGEGSEHVVGDTTVYPLVIHFVHTKEGIAIPEAIKHADGLAVLGLTFELTHSKKSRNKELDKIVKHLMEVKHRGEKRKIQEKLILDHLLPKDKSNFFRYHGSLTTPPCSEAVIWSVLVNTVNVTKLQLHEFRRLLISKESEDAIVHMVRNYRPIQSLNSRVIQLRFDVNDLPTRHGSMTAANFCSVIILAIALIMKHFANS